MTVAVAVALGLWSVVKVVGVLSGAAREVEMRAKPATRAVATVAKPITAWNKLPVAWLEVISVV